MSTIFCPVMNGLSLRRFCPPNVAVGRGLLLIIEFFRGMIWITRTGAQRTLLPEAYGK